MHRGAGCIPGRGEHCEVQGVRAGDDPSVCLGLCREAVVQPPAAGAGIVRCDPTGYMLETHMWFCTERTIVF